MIDEARRPWYGAVFDQKLNHIPTVYNEADMALKPGDDRILAVGGSSLELYDLQRGNSSEHYLSLEIRRVRWHPTDGKKLSTANVRRSYSLWDAERLEPLMTVKGEHFQYTQEWHPDGRFLILACDPGLRFVDPVEGMEFNSVAMDTTWTKLCWMDNNRFACADREGKLLCIYDLRNLSGPLVSLDPGVDRPNFMHPWEGGLLLLNELGRLSRLDDNGQISLQSDRFQPCLENSEPCLIAEAELLAIPLYGHVFLCDIYNSDNLVALKAGVPSPDQVITIPNHHSFISLDGYFGEIAYHHPEFDESSSSISSFSSQTFDSLLSDLCSADADE